MNDASLNDQRKGDVARFTEVDQAPDARFFVEFLDAANALPDVRPLKTVMVDELRLSPGARVLEVGCGTGDDARLLAALVGQDGQVVGVDASEAMVGVPQERSSDSSLPVEFALGDVRSLKFPDGGFDACRCERVLSTPTVTRAWHRGDGSGHPARRPHRDLGSGLGHPAD